MERALSRPLIHNKTLRELVAYLRTELPPPLARQRALSAHAWDKKAARIRQQMLELFFRGHPPDLLQEPPRIRFKETLHDGNKGYLVRKLLYEGYPGLWIPALLYEPTQLQDKVPAVLNPNGHHVGGKAMAYKQARCINLAKRGMLALNTEFIGMGELRASADHNRIAHLDLCGVAGIGVFYLIIKRSLDVLLDHRHADPARVAMTGLSGGGWQTALLAALDERVRVVVPVAGHSPVWQRAGCMEDIGDQEQVPSDLCTIADFDTLSAMFAPRPTLLIYNHDDDCCFQTRRTYRSIYQPIKPFFELLGAREKLAFHDNVDPGTHNYDSDNRSQLYQFLKRHWALDTPAHDLPWEDELYTEAELEVGLPPDNATLHSLARQALEQIRRQRLQRPPRHPLAARRRLSTLLKLPSFATITRRRGGASRSSKNLTVHQHILRLDDTWSLPVTDLAAPGSRGVELIVADGGRRQATALARQALAAGRRALVADIFATGEAHMAPRHQMLLATAGQRPLGLQVAQLNAVISWARRRFRVDALHLQAQGQVAATVALISAALGPSRLAALTTAGLLDSLDRLIDWPQAFESTPSLFCFGLLSEFDIPALIQLAAPLPLAEANRGPLRIG